MSEAGGADPRMAALPSGVAAQLQAGARALRDGDPGRAERELLDAVRQAPAEAEPLRYLAILQLHTRRAAQVRQPLAAVPRATGPYGTLLDPLRQALAAYGP